MGQHGGKHWFTSFNPRPELSESRNAVARAQCPMHLHGDEARDAE
jgi:hypothetical protein